MQTFCTKISLLDEPAQGKRASGTSFEAGAVLPSLEELGLMFGIAS